MRRPLVFSLCSMCWSVLDWVFLEREPVNCSPLRAQDHRQDLQSTYTDTNTANHRATPPTWIQDSSAWCSIEYRPLHTAHCPVLAHTGPNSDTDRFRTDCRLSQAKRPPEAPQQPKLSIADERSKRWA